MTHPYQLTKFNFEFSRVMKTLSKEKRASLRNQPDSPFDDNDQTNDSELTVQECLIYGSISSLFKAAFEVCLFVVCLIVVYLFVFTVT